MTLQKRSKAKRIKWKLITEKKKVKLFLSLITKVFLFKFSFFTPNNWKMVRFFLFFIGAYFPLFFSSILLPKPTVFIFFKMWNLFLLNYFCEKHSFLLGNFIWQKEKSWHEKALIIIVLKLNKGDRFCILV